MATPTPITGYERECNAGEGGHAIRDLLDRIGDKWSLLVIGTLHQGRLRFRDLRAHIPGISQRMLTLTLRNLQRDGLVTRTAYAEVPPRVEYELSPLGQSLVAPATTLASWAIAHQDEIARSRAAFDLGAAHADGTTAHS